MRDPLQKTRCPRAAGLLLRALGCLFLGLGLFCLADWTVGTPAVQASLWNAVGRRVASRDWFMGNVVKTRRIKAEEAAWARRGEIVLVGSSQVGAGFDLDRLETELEGTLVRMMSIGDMDSTRVLFALPYLCVGPDDVVVWYLSSRDVVATPPLHLNWMRPFSSWRGVAEILPLLDGRTWISSWRSLADLFLSATSELWRSRDYVRHVLLNAGGLNDPIRTTAAQDQLQRDMDNAVALREQLDPRERTALEDIQFAALGRAIQRLAQGRGRRLVVLEGQMNPLMETPADQRLKARLDAALREGSNDLGFTYLSIADQGLEHPASEWKDPSHLNAVGRDKLTGFLLDYFRRHPELRPNSVSREGGSAMIPL